LYVTDGGTDVIAVNAADGTVRWRRNLYDRVADAVPEKFLSPSNYAVDFSPIPVATPETVYIQSSYGLHGLAPGDGSERWRLYLGDHIDEAALGDPYGLAVTARRVWASYGGHVQALFTAQLSDDSLEIERARLPLEFPSRPVVTDDREAALTHDIVWGTSPQETLAVGVAGEDVEWQFPGYAGEGAAAYSPLATDGDRVFVAASHEQQEQLVVFALEAATGKLEWLHHRCSVKH
jgi:outer membrane protein assembly factor BamB